MKKLFLVLLIVSMPWFQGCAREFTGITGKSSVCQDGMRPTIDCNGLYGQTSPLSGGGVRLVLGSSESSASGVETGRVQYDSITADQYNNIMQLCVMYNNCLISRNDYLEQMVQTRNQQFNLRMHANSSTTDSSNSTYQNSDIGLPGFIEPSEPLRFGP
jgi:hypothetical protein